MIHENQKESNRKYQEKRRRRLGIETHAEKQKRFNRTFIRKSTEVHGAKYDYSYVVYKNVATKVKIKCLTHGMFEQTPDAHTRGQGCPDCARQTRKIKNTKRSTAEFIETSKQIHRNKYTYDKAEYITTTTKTVITCPIHGDFEQIPKAHLKGQGCPACANEARSAFYESKGEKNIEVWLKCNNIEYVKQKTFNELLDVMLLRYDFYLPNQNILIEYDGQQHYEFVPYFHGNVETFERQQYRDTLKTVYAEQHGFELLRIRYDEDIEEKLAKIVTF